MTVHEKLDKLISGNAFLGTILNEYTSDGAYTTGFTMNTPSDKEEFFLVMCYGQSINENVHASFSGSGYISSTRILYLQSASRSLGTTLMIYKIKATKSSSITITPVNAYQNQVYVCAAFLS